MRCTRLFIASLMLFAASAALQADTIIDTNAVWRFRPGQTEASSPDNAAWRALNFDDTAAGFTNAPSPFWYGDPYNGGTLLQTMLNGYTCIFLRKTFVVTNLSQVSALRFGAIVDDGFVVWINGVEVTRLNVTDANPTIATLAANANEPVPFVEYALPTPSGYLVQGTNIIAVQGFNTTLGSSDFGLNLSLRSILTETNPPTIASVTPAPGSSPTNLTAITVTFSEAVDGVTGDDLVVNGIAASGVSGSGATYTFTFPQPPYGAVPVSFGTNSGIVDLAVPPNPFNANAPSAIWQYTLRDIIPPTVATIFPQPGASVRSLGQIEITFSEDVGGVNAADLLVNNQPATNVIVQVGGKFIFQFAPPPPGSVSVAWANGHGIADLATPPNPFAAPAGWSYQFNPNATVGDLVINEILVSAVNTNGLNDRTATPEDPDPLPWIEIYNRGTNAIDLAGWALSDDADFPGQWVFPSRLLPAGQYLIVFASGLDIKNPTGTNRFHTNFKLSRGGEFVGLYSPDSPRTLVSGFTFPEQRNDISYGYDTNRQLRYFATPSPGAPNGSSSVTGVAEPVHFSVTRGHFAQPFDLALTCPTPGAGIIYTTNGSEPSLLNGFRYSNPLRVTNTTLLRAAAFRTNLLSSRIGTHTYFFNVAANLRSLPIISVVTAQGNLTGPNGIYGISNVTQNADGTFVAAANGYYNVVKHGFAWEKPTSVEFIRPEDNSGFQVDAGIRLQGSDYQRPRIQVNDKMSFRLYFRSDYGSGRLNYPLFPLTQTEGFDQIVLRAGFNELNNPFIRDELVRRISHDMGGIASHGTLSVVSINGNFFTSTRNAGNSPWFNPTERVHEEFMQNYLGGGGEWDVVGPSFAQSAGLPGVIDGDRADFTSLVSYTRTQQTTNPAVYQTIARRLDLVNFADYCLLNSYTAMGDWPQNNWRAGRERNNTNALWRFIVWDAEWGMGIYSRTSASNMFTAFGAGPEGGGLSSTNDSEIAQMYQRLILNPEFRLLWADRIQKHFFNGGALTIANYTNRLAQMRTELQPLFNMTDAKLLNWATDRLPIIMPQFNNHGLFGYSNATHGLFASSNAPAFNQHGGRVAPGFSVTMTTPIPGSAIYYTTNGADPRVMFSGAISNAAAAYTGAITLGQSTVIRARALLNGTNWSAINEATFEVARAGIPLRITEIHYNPADSPAYEFIELQNIGGAAVDLSGMMFDGINYTFLLGSSLAPGARLVLASDIDPRAFTNRYPGVAVFGNFGGNLNNGGERIALLDRFGNIIASVDYRDGGGWPIAADGRGSSLEVIDPAGGPDDPANWRASAAAGGTPGIGSATPALGNVRLNEFMAFNVTSVSNAGTFPDWVELFNAGATAANIGGWDLSDLDEAHRYVFPVGTTIPAGGYLVVWCDASTNTTPGLHTGFTLDRETGSLFLYDAGSNRVDAVGYGYQLADLSLGRVGGEWKLNQPTPNAANIAAPTASETNLIINEWLANPPAGLPDWVELFNRSASPVALRGLYVGTSNSVQQITSLSFVPAGGFVQLFCDEGVGWNHLDFRLPAITGAITLADTLGVEFDRVTYGAQAEGVTRGRLPNGSATFTNFIGSVSPGASNYLNTYPGPVINEVLARNQSLTNGGRVADFVELYNGGATAFNLGGMSLSVDSLEPGQWIFPPNTSLAANSYLVIWCDGSRPASTNAGDFNTGRSLDGESGGAYLFGASGQVVNSVVYGFQIADRPIAVIAGAWQLATAATPGAANSAAVTLGSALALRINEWMANPASGADWFELFNPSSAPVNLDGLLLTDDPSLVGTTNATRLAPLSFIDALGFVKCIADGQPEQGRNHVNFSLDAQGEYLRLYQANGTAPIDSVAFGVQLIGVSAGRLPDGADTLATFAGSPTPGESNYQLVPGVVIGEVLARSAAPLEDAVELQNRNSSSVAIGGWYLSDDQRNFKKFRIADGANIGANSFTVFYEAQFNGGASNRFTLDGARGGEVWLSAADPAGNLTGQRVRAKFGATSSGVSIGRVETSSGVDFAALSARTFGADASTTVTQFRTGLGASNAAPRVGPVVINEIMYHPTVAAGDEEFIELLNTTAAPVPLFDSTNTWQLNDAVSFRFPPNTTLAASGSLLVVGFDPANAALLNAFRSRYSIATSVPILGPWTGSLDNESDDIELLRPDVAEGGFTPYVRVDRVNYADAPPWASGAVDGGGLSLQRRGANTYGNEAKNWLADLPTPGRANGAGIVPPPVITQSPSDKLAFEGAATTLSVGATGGVPLGYQWRRNGFGLPQATNSSLVFDFTSLDSAGDYDVVVNNPGGVAVSGPARLTVVVPPEITTAPISVAVTPSNRVQFAVSVRGSEPITYQWSHDGVLLPGETGTTLIRDNVQLPDDGVYQVTASNAFGTVTASATLSVLVRPLFTVHPLSQSVVAGGDVTLSVSASGNPLPFTFRFLRNGATVAIFVLNSRDSFYTITNIQGAAPITYRSAVTNLAGNSPGSSNAVITILADTDGDGLPDEWETAYGLDLNNNNDRNADADNDGATNLQEYRAGTDPTNSASFLKIDSLSLTGGTTLRFGTISNKTYTVQYTDRLGSGPWQRLADVVAQPTNSVQTISDPVAATNRFYRVASPWQP